MNYHKFRSKFRKVVTVSCSICGQVILTLDAPVAESQVFLGQQFRTTKAMYAHMRERHPEVKDG